MTRLNAIAAALLDEFPELETDEPIEGSDAVDSVCRLYIANRDKTDLDLIREILADLIDETNAIENTSAYRSPAHCAASHRGNCLRSALAALAQIEQESP